MKISYMHNNGPVYAINSQKPDYYLIGKNCKTLMFTETDINTLLDTEMYEGISQEEIDLILEGYYN